MKDPVLLQLSSFISEYSASAHIYLAYSGGLDSAVLLHALCELLPDRNQLTVLHLNHNLQSQSSAWVQRCESECSALGVVLKVHNLNLEPGSHEEERARNARYAYFSQTLKAGDVLLMAHHMNDAVETLLFRLMRGSSTRGLAGIPEYRSLGQGVLHRPFLNLKRKQLEVYASRSSLQWVKDPSNQNMRFDRSYLRARVLPVLLKRWPGALEHLADSIARLKEDNLIVVAWLDEHLEPMLISSWELDLKLLAFYSAVQSKRLIRHWLERCGCFFVSKAQLEEIYRQCLNKENTNPVFTLPGIRAAEPGFEYQLRRYRARLLFCNVYRGELELNYPWLVLPGASPQILELPHGELIVESDAEFPVLLSFEVRFPRPGQKVYLSSTATNSGYHKSLASLFQEAGIPAWQRSQYPLIYDAGNLFEIPGVRTLPTSLQEEYSQVFTWCPKQPLG